MIFSDFHCHLYSYDSGAVMDKICKNIITPDQETDISVGMILNNIRENNLWEKGAEFCLSKNRGDFIIIPFIGIHPWDSAEAGEKTITSLEEISSKTGVFLGEFGFDKLKGADADKQLYIFRNCLEIALKSEKPFTIHCVRSWGFLTEELDKIKKRIKAPFIIHAFNGSADIAKKIISLGGYPSFGLERYNAFSRKAEGSILKINLKRLLLETDFTCYSGQLKPEDAAESENSINAEYTRNDNFYGNKYIKRLIDVYNKAALLLKIDIQELSGVIEENGKIFKAYTINRK